MNILAIDSEFSYSCLGRCAGTFTGLSLRFFFVFALTGCDPGSQTMNNSPSRSISATGATPSPVRPQAELAAAFDASVETILDATTSEQLAKITALRQVSLAPASNGLKVTASGTDPSVFLPVFVEGKKCILQVVIDTPSDTPIQVFYPTRDHPDGDEARSQVISSKQGRNIVYFQLDQPNLMDPVRLDPGATPGVYLIESVVARKIGDLR